MSHAAGPDTRERIMDIAANLFSEDGYNGVSMRDIANAVGIKAASLYNHFSDKEDLYLAALENVFRERVSNLDRALKSQGTAQERLLATLKALMDSNTNDPTSTKLLQRELLSGDTTHQKWLTERLFKAPFDQMVSLLEEIGPAGRGETNAIYLSALSMGLGVLGPLLEQLGTSAYTTDADAISRDITQTIIADAKENRP
jgi:AcrR family transcriptional regulator